MYERKGAVSGTCVLSHDRGTAAHKKALTLREDLTSRGVHVMALRLLPVAQRWHARRRRIQRQRRISVVVLLPRDAIEDDVSASMSIARMKKSVLMRLCACDSTSTVPQSLISHSSTSVRRTQVLVLRIILKPSNRSDPKAGGVSALNSALDYFLTGSVAGNRPGTGPGSAAAACDGARDSLPVLAQGRGEDGETKSTRRRGGGTTRPGCSGAARTSGLLASQAPRRIGPLASAAGRKSGSSHRTTSSPVPRQADSTAAGEDRLAGSTATVKYRSGRTW